MGPKFQHAGVQGRAEERERIGLLLVGVVVLRLGAMTWLQ